MLDPIGSTAGYFQLSADYLYLSTLYLLASALVLVNYADSFPGVVIVPNLILGWTFLCCALSVALVLAASRTTNPLQSRRNPASPVGNRLDHGEPLTSATSCDAWTDR